MRKTPFKRSAALAAALIFSSTPALAEDAAATVETIETAPTGPALWKAADEDTTIYLFGTVHALPEDVKWFDGEIAEALASSEAVVTEIDMDEAMAASMQQLVTSKGILPEDVTLRSLLDEEEKAAFETAMGKNGGERMRKTETIGKHIFFALYSKLFSEIFVSV